MFDSQIDATDIMEGNNSREQRSTNPLEYICVDGHNYTKDIWDITHYFNWAIIILYYYYYSITNIVHWIHEYKLF